MCPPSCCASTCCNVIYYICLAAIFIYLVLCVALIPKYRYVAIMVLGIVALYAASAWRLLPSERHVVRERAEVLARLRCRPPAPAVSAPPCPTPTAASMPAAVATYQSSFTANGRS